MKDSSKTTAFMDKADYRKKTGEYTKGVLIMAKSRASDDY